ncbi:16S rRNA (uracil(1498)-N(3))-methyltransferase [Puniceicoccaceae bacterium K14]|nr:16S rRNA (uracil(1498)-N(3))-methyltransferase [Puniceicoccaceae bacterium K14]
MNIVLFDPTEVKYSKFARTDKRIGHILEVLRRKIGDETDVGLINGPRGKAILLIIEDDYVELDFIWGLEPEPLLAIDLIVGISRPQTCRKILQEATSLGVRSIRFIETERGEPSYASSKLWTTEEWRTHVRLGVEQAFSTRFPKVYPLLDLKEAIASLDEETSRVCLDNYEAKCGLGEFDKNRLPITLAIGSERGWTGLERDCFRANGFTLAHLGERPLRTETATIAAIGILSALL